MYDFRSSFLLTLIGFCFFACQSNPQLNASLDKPFSIAAREQVEAHGKKWVVSTQGILATEAAVSTLKAGGNLMDAAVAASFAISVERPQSTGIGGGGFMIYYEAKTKTSHVIDFRERAPTRASKDMYLDKMGKVIEERSTTGGVAVGVPGLVRGLAHVHKKWGKAKWNTLLKPAISYAEKGFLVYPHLALALREELTDLQKFSASKNIFLSKVGAPKVLGDRLVQADLAKTLKLISENSEVFYRGKIAVQIVATVKKYQGIMTEADMASYQVKERKAVSAQYKGYEIISMPPPSSGGIHVIQILKMLEQDDLNALGFLSPESIHLEAQAMQQAFADRSKYLGDPDFVKVPITQLIDEKYLLSLRKKFTPRHARKTEEVSPGEITVAANESENTTHLSLMDEEGNVIVSTQSINGFFGSKVVAERTGIVLNNTMDDFSVKPGVKNIYGAIGSDANSIYSKKTPLSSMSPTIVLKNEIPILALGAPGGTRIITAVAQTIFNYLDFHKSLYDSISAPRIHHQWVPDELTVENQSITSGTLNELDHWGYKIKRVSPKSHIMAVAREGNDLIGVSDPRDIGTSAGE